MLGSKQELGEHGKVSVYKRGYGWLPGMLRKELDAEAPSEIPFFIDANVALLIKKDATKEDVMKGLSALIKHLSVKWKISEGEVKKILGL